MSRFLTVVGVLLVLALAGLEVLVARSTPSADRLPSISVSGPGQWR